MVITIILCINSIYAVNIDQNNSYSNDNNITNSTNNTSNNIAAGEPLNTTFTDDQIKEAATTVRTYTENNGKLPYNITIGSTQLTMPQFLELLTTATIQINNENNNTIPLKNYTTPPNPLENIIAGNIYKTEYLKIANEVKNYMDNTGKTPDFAYQTSLGTYLRYENLIYMYSMILDYYNTSGNKADFAEMKTWSAITNPILSTFTINEIKQAASIVKNYTENNRNLPSSVIIGSTQVTMPQFLELLVTATIRINKNDTINTIPLRDYSSPTGPIENIIMGYILKGEYLTIANDIKNYMDASGKTPDFVFGISLGKYFSYQSAVFMFSKILDSYKTQDILTDSVLVTPWWRSSCNLGSTDYGEVVRLGPFGNVFSSVKIAYIVGVHPIESASHQALIDTISTYDASLNYCYYIYQVKVTRDASNYEIGRMNGQLLANAFAVPNIIDQGCNLAIDIHSNVGNWAYTRFVFSPVPGTSSEWSARDLVNRISWLTYYFPPSQTSPQYVTIPIINAGIPAIVYETYTYESYDITVSHARDFVLTVDSR
jgi:hypothetical protein